MEKFDFTKLDNKAKSKMLIDTYKKYFGNITKLADELGIVRETFYNWKRKKSFRKKLEKARLLLVEELEDVAISRSFEGSDTMLKFLLTKLCPEKYGDKLELEAKGNSFEQFVLRIHAERQQRLSEEDGENPSPSTLH